MNTTLNVFDNLAVVFTSSSFGTNSVFYFSPSITSVFYNFEICSALNDLNKCFKGYFYVKDEAPSMLPLCYTTLTYHQSLTIWPSVTNTALKSNYGEYSFFTSNPGISILLPLFTHSFLIIDQKLSGSTNHYLAVRNANYRSWSRQCSIKPTNFPSLINELDFISTQTTLEAWWPLFPISGLTGYTLTFNQTSPEYFGALQFPIVVNVPATFNHYMFTNLDPNAEFSIVLCSISTHTTCSHGIYNTLPDMPIILSIQHQIYGIFPVIVTPAVPRVFGLVSFCFVIGVETTKMWKNLTQPPTLSIYLTHTHLSIDGYDYHVVAAFNSDDCHSQQTLTLGDRVQRGTFNNPPLRYGFNYSAFFVACMSLANCRTYPQYTWYQHSFIPHSSILSRTLFFIIIGFIVLSALVVCFFFRDEVFNRVKFSGSFKMVDPQEVIKTIQMDIPPSEFDQYVSSSSSNGYYKLSKEFLALSHVCPEKTCQIAALDVNSEKNRYKNIIPYDDSLVILQSSHTDPTKLQSNYINANFINGADKSNEYIATQGPLPNTIVDFWRMVCDYKCKGIVMLTKVEERGKVKCEQYWPESGVMTVENFTIEAVKVVSYYDLVCTNLKVTRKQENGNTIEHTLWHLFFLDWLDHSVPSGFEGMRFLLRKTRELVDYSKDPLIVHCSAGVGRTGAFLCYDMNVKLLGLNQPLGIFKTIKKLRECRTQMVQTEDQYIYLHMAILDRVLNPETTRSLSQFASVASNIDSKYIDLEYSRLDKLRSVYDKKTLDETERVFYDEKLFSNARYVTGYQQIHKCMLIVKNSGDSFEELKKLFHSNNVQLVIDLTDKQSVKYFYDDIQNSSCEIVTVNSSTSLKKFSYSIKDENFSLYSVKVDFSSSNEEALDSLFECYANVFSRTSSSKNMKIAIISDDMSTYASLAHMVGVVQEQMVVDGTIGIYETTRRVLSRFPQLLTSKDLYGCLVEFMKVKVAKFLQIIQQMQQKH